MSILQQQIKKSEEDFDERWKFLSLGEWELCIKNVPDVNQIYDLKAFLRQQLIDYHKAILSALKKNKRLPKLRLETGYFYGAGYSAGFIAGIEKAESILGEGEVSKPRDEFIN